MIKKGNLWFADWHDENGKRCRRGFVDPDAALAFTQKMRREAASRKALAPGCAVESGGFEPEGRHEAVVGQNSEATKDPSLADFRTELFAELRKLVKPAIAQAKKGKPELLRILSSL